MLENQKISNWEIKKFQNQKISNWKIRKFQNQIGGIE